MTEQQRIEFEANGFLVIPHDDRLHDWIEIPEDMAIPAPAERIDRIGPKPLEIADPVALDGMIVNVELIEYADKGERAVGRVIEILGSPEDFGIGESIQRNFRSGANHEQTFGKFEKALGWYHREIDKAVG